MLALYLISLRIVCLRVALIRGEGHGLRDPLELLRVEFHLLRVVDVRVGHRGSTRRRRLLLRLYRRWVPGQRLLMWRPLLGRWLRPWLLPIMVFRVLCRGLHGLGRPLR